MMPKGPTGQKWPADVIGNAVHVAKIPTGEEAEDTTNKHCLTRSKAGRMGGKVRGQELAR